MLDNQRKMKEMMVETTSELSGKVETEYKKNVQNARVF
jgi:hypothetical protein